jgi:hypothetical protein
VFDYELLSPDRRKTVTLGAALPTQYSYDER